MRSCLNCGQPLQSNFCCHCGQKASTHRFTMAHVLHEIPHSVFHLDTGIFRNIRSIAYPRRAVQDYLAGKRKAYFNPLLFYFLTLGVILFVAPKLNVDTTLVIEVSFFEVEGYGQGKWINPFAKFLYFGCAFLFAFPNYYLFRRQTGFTYPEQVVACFFMMGYVNLVIILSLPFADTAPFSRISAIAMMVFTFLIYNRGNRIVTLLKSIVSVFACLLLLTLVLLWIGFIGYLVLLILK